MNKEMLSKFAVWAVIAMVLFTVFKQMEPKGSAGAGHNANMFALQTYFFMQFPNHGLLGGFAPIDAALRKLPGVRPNTLAPKHLIFLVEQDDADIGPKAVPVKHNQTPNF